MYEGGGRVDDEEVMTVEEAAAVLHVHPDTVRRLFDAGELTGRKSRPGPGGWRFPYRASVEAYRRRQHGEAADRDG